MDGARAEESRIRELVAKLGDSPSAPSLSDVEPAFSSAPPVSVLYRRPDEERHERGTAPDFFGDLHLDRIVAAAVAGREEYGLLPFFQTALTDPEAISYRQEVMRDLEKPETRVAIDAFADQMRLMRKHLASEAKAYYVREKQRWHLAAR